MNHDRKHRVLCLLMTVLLLTGCSVQPDARPVETATPEPTEVISTAKPSPTPTLNPEERSKLVIDPNIGATPTPVPTEPGIAIPGWTAMNLPANSDEAEVALYNPIANEGWYYLTFQVTMRDSNEVLFTTGLVPPGAYVTRVQLNRRLEPGEYTATMFVQPYRINDELTPTNNASMQLHLYVK